MAELSLTTCVYRYSRYANWMLIIYCLATLGLFFSSLFLPDFGVIIYCVVIFGLPIYVGLNQKSVFSVRRWDEKPFIITVSSIHFGDDIFEMQNLQDLSIYIFTFQGFRHEEETWDGKHYTTSEYGDQNQLSFKMADESYSFDFYLASYMHYNVLLKIISAWQADSIPLTARTAFEDDYVRKQMIDYGYGDLVNV